MSAVAETENVDTAKQHKQYSQDDLINIVRTVNSSSSYDEAAEKLGMTRKKLYMKASELRRKGVRLKKFARPKPKGRVSRFNFQELNSLFDE